MRSSLRRRLEQLERAIARARRSPGEVLFDTFSTDVQSRMHRTGESFEQACDAVAEALSIDEMKLLILNLEGDHPNDSLR